ncbi:plasmid pRiA4b ORF-3 family protein [Spirosoma spitsbergense]|uniref:plasmid pRiA4b ORF-3 family protein n=1 Tax=Spirosoma spitsbergense TaxID=431554 RepID=UPI0003733E76|nr:plasmid pRiA4b ORF-3 family protein [Spirosoma spitsbergense]
MLTPYDFSSSLLIDDVDIFLRYLEGKPNLPLTAAGDLKAADLWILNDRVNYKAPDYVTNRSRQIDYPLLGFLFQIATASRLFLVKSVKGNVLVADAARLDMYRSLTVEEQYVFLLETAWCYADWSAIDGDERSGVGANWFQSGIRQLLQNPVGAVVTFFERGGSLEKNPAVIHTSFSANAYIRVGYWFGWYDIREVARTKRDKYELDIDQLILTEWGQQCLTVLLRDRPFRQWNRQAGNYAYFDEYQDDDERVNINAFADVFRTLLDEPDLLSLYPINPNPPTGVYWIRAELPALKVSRTIELPTDMTLEDLHEMIQQAFDFDNDHLFKFCMNLRNPYRGEQYYDPRPEAGWSDGYPADDVSLASLNLYEGQQFLYIFDFGDRWDFKITVVRHLPDERTDNPRIVEAVGEAPAQYGDEE